MPGISGDLPVRIDAVRDPGALADLLAHYVPAKLEEKLRFLQTIDVGERLKLVVAILARRREVLSVAKDIAGSVQEKVSRAEREHLLRKQLEAIQAELGEDDDGDEAELEKKIEKLGLPAEVLGQVTKELARLRKLPAASPERAVARTWLQWIVDLPWSAQTEDNLEVENARRTLDADHHGLSKVKERILQFLAVRTLRGDLTGPILCLVGPPGVGKTSLGQSVARAMGRKFVRVSLGGVRDEAEIRGHRRTYVGAMPGRIVQAFKRAGTSNPAAWALVQQAEKAQKDAGAVVGTDLAAAARLYGRADSLLAAAEQIDGAWIEPVVLRARVAYQQSRAERDPRAIDRAFQVGLRHAERAVQMNPQSPDALEIRGTLRFWRYARGLEPDVAAAERLLAAARKDLEDATRLNPRQVGAWTVLSRLYWDARDLLESNRAARTAYEADAFLAGADAILNRLFLTSYDLELFQPALDWCQKGYRRFPADSRFVECQLMLLSTNARDPDVGEAWRLVDEYTRLIPERDRPLQRLYAQVWAAAVLGRAGLRDSAHRVLERSRGDATVDPERDVLGYQAAVYTMIGDKDDALRVLGEYLVANPRHREGFRKNVHWWWRSLQDDTRFKALIGAR